jgi:hypothetical protein
MLRTGRLRALLLPMLALCVQAAQAGTPYKIVTASERGTYIQIGRDLAKFIAPSSLIDLEAVPSAGSAENIHRLRYEPGVKLALVQSDVYQAFINQSNAGDANAAAIIKPLRVIMPLYNEELYFIVRADSPLNHVHEIRDSRINVGALRSGTAMTSTTLYRMMFDRPVSDEKISFHGNEDALIKLTGDKSVDVVVVVAGQPAKLLVDMKPEARALIKLLKFDPEHPASKTVLRTYFATSVRAANYPNLLTEDIPALAVKAYLVTYDYNQTFTKTRLGQFAKSMCDNFGQLQAGGHPKWKEVSLAMPQLGQGWSYFGPTARELDKCVQKAAAKTCTTEQKILGLCQ